MKQIIKKFIFVAFFSIAIVSYCSAYETDIVNYGDTLETIAKRNYNRFVSKYPSYNNYKKRMMLWNPRIKNWDEPTPGEYVFVEYPYDLSKYIINNKVYTGYLGKAFEAIDENKKFSLNFFYSTSFGSYKEELSDQFVKSDQNFPFTLGLGFSKTNEIKTHFLFGSAYWAQPSKGKLATGTNSTTTTFAIPGEIGGNLYYQYYLREYSIGIYGGYDFEKLNTFNTAEIIEGAEISNVSNNIHYATLGASYGFTLFTHKMNLKASLSKTIKSTTDKPSIKELSGSKYILNYTYKPPGRFNFNVFYKHHSLVGPTKLSIDRIGFSLGIFLF